MAAARTPCRRYGVPKLLCRENGGRCGLLPAQELTRGFLVLSLGADYQELWKRKEEEADSPRRSGAVGTLTMEATKAQQYVEEFPLHRGRHIWKVPTPYRREEIE